MPKITLPANPGHFRVETSRAGNYIVINNKTGKSQVIIPMSKRQAAEELCKRLNEGDHQGTITVPALNRRGG